MHSGITDGQIVEEFALGETIPVIVERIRYEKKTPESLAGLRFVSTVIRASTREEMLRLSEANMSIDDNDGKPTIFYSIEANFEQVGDYEFDLYVIDPETGRHQLKFFTFRLQKSPTTNFNE